MPTSPIPNRADRIDLQPDNITSRVYNIDPTTGLPLASQYEIRDSSGNLVYTDESGNVLFNGLTTFGDLRIENIKGAKRFSKTITQYDLATLLRTLDFNISELTGGVVNTINFVPTNIIREGGGFGTGIGEGGFGGGGGNGPGGAGPGAITTGNINDLLDLINSLNDEIDRLNIQLKDCELLKSAIDELKIELDSVLADNEDLLDLVEALQACKERLERVLTAKNNEVIRLADELARSAVANANLELRITALEKMNDELRRQNTELATRPEVQIETIEVPVIIQSQPEGGDGGTGGGGGGGGPVVLPIPESLKKAAQDSVSILINWSDFISNTVLKNLYISIRGITSTTNNLSVFKEQGNLLVSQLNEAYNTARNFTSYGSPDERLVETYSDFVRDLQRERENLNFELSKV